MMSFKWPRIVEAKEEHKVYKYWGKKTLHKHTV